MTLPKVVMISISNNPISQYYKQKVEPSWIDHGYKVDHFEAVTPEKLNSYSYLQFGKKRGTIDFTPTEIACWYSHVECWVLARSQPLLIIEHDIEHKRDIDPSIFESDMSCLASSNKEGTRKLAGGAYYLTPDIAKKMVQDVKNMKSITYNSDAFIHNFCDKYGVWSQDKCYQVQNPKIGYTVVHNK